MGGGGKTKTSVQDVTPKYIQEQNIKNIKFANTVADKPYQRFDGQRVAGLDPIQQQAIDSTQALGTQGQGLVQRGFDILSGMGTADQRIGAYMNPYTDEVISRSMSDLERQRQIMGTQTAGQAIANKAFGGSRQAVADSLNNENFARQFGDLSANLRMQGFNTALGAAQNEMTQQQQLAQLLSQTGAGAIGEMGQVGDFLRGLKQQQLDVDYGDFVDERDYDLQRLGIMQSAAQNAPFQSNATSSTSPDRIGQGLQAGVAIAGAVAF